MLEMSSEPIGQPYSQQNRNMSTVGNAAAVSKVFRDQGQGLLSDRAHLSNARSPHRAHSVAYLSALKSSRAALALAAKTGARLGRSSSFCSRRFTRSNEATSRSR